VRTHHSLELAHEPDCLQGGARALAAGCTPLYKEILEHVPVREVDPDAPLQMLVVTLDHSDFVGRIAIGRVMAGKIKKGQRVAC